MKTKLTREELYSLVWSSPLSVLAKKYNISDNGLRKICKRVNVPLPKNGYWQKIKHGKRPPKIELSTKFTGDNEVSLEVVTENTVRITTITEQVRSLQRELELELKDNLIVPGKLSKPDNLIVGCKERFNASKRRDWSSKVFDQYPEALNISVSEKNHPRALLFFDTLIKALKIRKHSIQFGHKSTDVIIYGEKIEIRLKEKSRMIKVVKNNWTTTEYEPTGILYFAVKASYHDKIWEDGKILIEQQLSNIIAYMEIKGEELHQRTLRWAEERRIQEEEKRKGMEYKERAWSTKKGKMRSY